MSFFKNKKLSFIYILRRIALIIVLFFFVKNADALVEVSNQTNFSLITCSPGTEVYSLFGHSAIRLEDKSQDIDIVFNYGLFSFESENFYWNFSRGYTDYLLGVQRFNNFIQEYISQDRTVLQQNLNLNLEQKQQLIDLLMTNLQPENRVYRYNYFTNNCATKLRDIVLECAPKDVDFYTPVQFNTSYREVVRPYLKPYAWTWLGTDVCLGMPADYEIHYWETMFLPDYLSEGFSKSNINDAGLVKSELKLNNGSDPVLQTPLLLTPVWMFTYLFLGLLILTIIEFKRGVNLKYVDFCLYLFIGLAGIVISFFSFISVHPTVYPNLNLLWAVPFHVIFAFFLLKNSNKTWKLLYRKLFGGLVILVFAIHLFEIQYINYSLFPVFGSILLRSKLGIIPLIMSGRK